MATSANMAPFRGIGTIILFFLLWSFWIVFLAGIAASQRACVDSTNAVTNGFGSNGIGRKLLESEAPDFMEQTEDFFGGARRMLSETGASRSLLQSIGKQCSTNYSLAWWLVWFEFFIIILAMCAAISVSFNANFGLSVVIFMAIETAVLMFVASQLNSTIVYTNSNTPDESRVLGGARCAMAGVVVLLILNLLYIWFASSRSESMQPCLNFGHLSRGVDGAAPPAVGGGATAAAPYGPGGATGPTGKHGYGGGSPVSGAGTPVYQSQANSPGAPPHPYTVSPVQPPQ